jgi:hypothetical protein
MTIDPLPHHLPMYCMFCGTRLTYTEIREVAGEGSASWKCTGCGRENTNQWEGIEFIPVDQTDQSSTEIETDIEIDALSPDYPFPLPPPPPSFFDNSEAGRVIYEQYMKEHLEYQKHYEALSRQIEADGIAALLKAMHFPLFALIDIRERFPFTSYQWGGGWGTGKTQLLLSNIDLRYEGPDYPKNTERIAIDQRGKEINPKSRLIDRASHPIHTSYIVNFLASLTGTEEPTMQALHQGMAIYQYVNIGAILLTTAVHTSIKAQSGEVVSWSIWRFNAPLPLVYAGAQIENTTISVGAIGPAADEIENLLGQLTRLTPESAVLDQVDLGARAWKEYLQHFYRTRFDQR